MQEGGITGCRNFGAGKGGKRARLGCEGEGVRIVGHIQGGRRIVRLMICVSMDISSNAALHANVIILYYTTPSRCQGIC